MKLGIAGATGRMGIALIKQALEHDGVEEVIAQVREGKIEEAEVILRKAGIDTDHTNILITEHLETLFDANAVIDFTRPELTAQLAALASKFSVPLISGTTGLNEDQTHQLKAYSEQAPIVWAPNMSICVNLLMTLVEKAASLLGDEYDIEIVEMHHRNKVDAPSGTALGLGQAAAKGRGVDFNTHSTLSREGDTGIREKGSIGFAALRGGAVIGDHSVIFAGPNERVELTHLSQSRDIYAEGAIKAALWAIGKPSGLYSMQDVLGIEA